MSIFGIVQQDIVNATSRDTVTVCFDDGNDGTTVFSAGAFNACVDRGEQEVLSWLSELGPPPFSSDILAQIGADPFLKYAAIEYIVAHMYDRHPEYVRNGYKDRDTRFKRADERMQRVLDARQRPPTVPTPPANVGGVSVDNANRLFTDSPDGRRHSGDY